MLQSNTSPSLASHLLGLLPADEREERCPVATQPLQGEDLGMSEHAVIDRVPHSEHVVTDHVYDDEDRSQLSSPTTCLAGTSDPRDILEDHMDAVSSSEGQSLNPNAKDFVMRDAALVHGGRLRPDLDEDWTNVQEVHSGTKSQQSKADCSSWSAYQPELAISGQDAVVEKNLDEPLLHLSYLADDLGSSQAAQSPAKPLLRASSLKDIIIMTPSAPFIDKILPDPRHQFQPRET